MAHRSTWLFIACCWLLALSVVDRYWRAKFVEFSGRPENWVTVVEEQATFKMPEPADMPDGAWLLHAVDVTRQGKIYLQSMTPMDHPLQRTFRNLQAEIVNVELPPATTIASAPVLRVIRCWLEHWSSVGVEILDGRVASDSMVVVELYGNAKATNRLSVFLLHNNLARVYDDGQSKPWMAAELSLIKFRAERILDLPLY